MVPRSDEGIQDLAVLFVDISDSSRIYEDLGDADGRTVVMACLDLLALMPPIHDGRVLERIGDELLCLYPTASSAAHSAILMQTGLRDAAVNGQIPSHLGVRIGFHAGPVVMEDRGVFGDTVHLAKRVSSLAKQGQILTTGDVSARLTGDLTGQVRLLKCTHVKGRSEPVHVWELLWDLREATVQADALEDISSSNCALDVRLGDQTWRIDPCRPVLKLGKRAPCDVVVQDAMASRIHARIELRGSSFVLQDMSTNGTFIQDLHGHSRHIHLSQAILAADGWIGLGRLPDPENGHRVRFQVVVSPEA